MIHTQDVQIEWFKALTLSERIARGDAKKLKDSTAVDMELAAQRLNAWQAQAPFEQDTLWQQYLASIGLSHDDFAHILGVTPELLATDDAPPEWLATLLEAFAQSTAQPATQPGHLLDLLHPLIAHYQQQLRNEIQVLHETFAVVPFDFAAIEAMIWSNCLGQLHWQISRTLVLELHVARLQGFLEGETPEARFQSFVERLRQPETALALLQEYPVLARQLSEGLERWVQVCSEFLHHLCSDWAAICATFSPNHDPGLLSHISFSGDTHRSGRSVVVVSFSSGFKIVYKPKPLHVEEHFQELLHWLNAHGDHPPFRTIAVLNRGSYGWVEFVAAQACTDRVQLHRFYQRQGGFLALLYALQATDFHHENLIAAGEDPVLIDLESLFHPQPDTPDLSKANAVAGQMMNYSVLRVGLLPRRLWLDDASEGVDISGLGATDGQLTPTPVPLWAGSGTDEMRLERQRVRMSAGNHRPVADSQAINVAEFVDEVIDGFTRMYQLLQQHRAALLADDGPLARFANDEIRVILRPTRTYSLLLRESFHPDVLRDALDRDQLFDRLWGNVPYQSYLARVIAAEQADLWRGDIPMFTTRPASRDLWTSNGVLIPDFFVQPGLRLVQHHIEQLDAADLAQQIWFIRASFATMAMGDSHWAAQQGDPTSHATPASRQELLAAAQQIGDRLATLALRGNDDANWLGVALIREKHWTLVPLGLDLYNGLPGMIFFLAYLGALSKNEAYTDLARAALVTLRQQLVANQANMKIVGGFSGWGGVIYLLTHLSALWNDPTLLDEAETWVELLPPLIEQDEFTDIISGTAGCIGGLLSLYRLRPSAATLDAAIHCGDRLLATAQRLEHGVGWTNVVSGQQALAGFSHGVAGIAWALLQLADISGEERFRVTALEAIAYERSLFSPTHSNWPDLREIAATAHAGEEEQGHFMAAWCHGAPGVGLGRLDTLRLLDDAAVRDEIAAALAATLRDGFGMNHSLCHGDLGNLELFLMASLTLGDAQLHNTTYRIAGGILASAEQQGWLCGVPMGIETPNLMTGLAGIGYQLLRLADPQQVPALLVMAPPH